MKQPVVHGQIGRRLHDRPDTIRTDSPACSETEYKFHSAENSYPRRAESSVHNSANNITGPSGDTRGTDTSQAIGRTDDQNCNAQDTVDEEEAAEQPSPAERAFQQEACELALRSAIGDQHFEHWFADRSRIECDGEILRIYVSNPFLSNWLLKRYRTSFARAASDVLGPSGSFELLVDERLQPSESTTAAGPASSSGQQSADASARDADAGSPAHRATSQRQAGTHPAAASTVRSLAANTTAEPSATANSRGRSRSKAVTSTSGGPQPLAVRRSQRRRFRNLNAIVTGQCNQLAVMASRQVADQPGECFNPLYLHGTTGVGKTHLLEGIYSEVRRQHPELNVVFISSEAFTNYFTQALESRTVPSFRQRFRNVDVLLVDNIEFLNNKKKATEEEFLHTIVQVIEHGGQLVVTGDRHPRLLTRHREELTTRFMSGLVCRIESPSDDVRRKVATSLALPRKECFTQEALDYVARRFRKNIREIQGAINCLHGHYSLNQQRITIARAREILGELEDECRRLVRINDVEKVVCEAFGLTATDLRSKSRRKAVACPRSLAMYVARKLTRSAYREIGSYFGGRDHSTVVAAEKRVKGWINNEAPLELPTSCNGKTICDVVQELEQRLLSLAS